MASSNLKAFLEKLQTELTQKGASDAWRTATGNLKTHDFVYSSTTIKRTVRDLLNRSNEYKGQTEEIREAIKLISPEITELTKNLRKAFQAQAKEGDILVNIAEPRGGVSVTVLEQTSGKNAGRDNYAKIYRIYKDHLEEFYQAVLAKLNKKMLTRQSASNPKETREIKKSGQAFNLEHIQGSNVEHFINDVVHKALAETFGNRSLGPKQQALIKDLGLGAILEVIKDPKSEKVTVTIRSQILNAIAGGGEEKKILADLKKALQKLDVPNLKGSDSIVETNRKKTVKKLLKPFKNKKTLKVVSENLSIAKKSKAKNKIKPKIKKAGPLPFPVKKKQLRPEKSNKQSQSMFSIMAMINQKLPQTVEKNMKSPGLESRTGRFAQSVRLTDVSTTRQGFPSFGYTYQTNPYQVFEMGRGKSPWSTPQRDPRTVIDASIREIAAEMAIGRFYTRRV
jgi:hypothetical protein